MKREPFAAALCLAMTMPLVYPAATLSNRRG